MAKKYIPSPSDFAKPTPGKKLKKGEVNNIVPSKAKKQRKSKRAFLAEEEKLKPGYVPVETVKKVFVKKEKTNTKLTNKNYKPGEHPIFEGSDLSNINPKQKTKTPQPVTNEIMPLNKYISHCGICSRRDAVEIIKEGKIKVNE